MECVGVERFLRFSRRREHKHLIFTTHVEKQCTRALNQGVLEYQTFREPYFNAYTVRIFTSNAFSICLNGHFNAYCPDLGSVTSKQAKSAK